MKRILAGIALVVLALVSSGVSLAVVVGDVPAIQEALVGLWRICYEPGREGQSDVDEPSFGYLLFMPNGTYYEVREDCCDPPRFMHAPREYEVHGSRIVLSAERVDGTAYERTLDFVGEKSVSFFENGRFEEPVRRPVLAVGRDLNYGWARIFP